MYYLAFRKILQEPPKFKTFSIWFNVQLINPMYGHSLGGVQKGSTWRLIVIWVGAIHKWRPANPVPDPLAILHLDTRLFMSAPSFQVNDLILIYFWLGYCVVVIDNRGSHFRGVAFESHLRLKMGQLELSDQVKHRYLRDRLLLGPI